MDTYSLLIIYFNKMPLTNFDITITFNLKADIPHFVFEDSNDYTSDSDTLAEAAFGVVPKEGKAWLDGVLSRKKQVVPPLQEILLK